MQAFPPRDYLDPSGPPPRGVIRNLRIMFDVTDVVDDVHGVVDDTARPLCFVPTEQTPICGLCMLPCSLLGKTFALHQCVLCISQCNLKRGSLN